MEVWTGREGIECDECCAKLNGKKYIHIGEESHRFEHDTRQAILCKGCVKQAYIKINIWPVNKGNK